jgi:biopolymer transport protein ExbD
MAFSTSSRGIKSDINVTPLIDVVLVLLIIFMVVTPLLERGKSVNLPNSKRSDESKEQQETVVISMPSDNTLWVEGTSATTDTLGELLARELAQHPGKKVMLKGDETLKVKPVREIMAIAKGAGVNQVLLGVEEQK